MAEALRNLNKAEAAFKDELEFVKPFVDRNEGIVCISVLGSPVDVSHSVVRLHEESMLATAFDSSKWKSQPQNLDEDGRYMLVSGKGNGICSNTDREHVFIRTRHSHAAGGLFLCLPEVDRRAPLAHALPD